jgi:hypothetical protein
LERAEAGFELKPRNRLNRPACNWQYRAETSFNLWQLFTPFITVASAIQSKPKPFTAGRAPFQAFQANIELPNMQTAEAYGKRIAEITLRWIKAKT